MSDRDALAVVVPKPDADRVIEALRAEGVYDDARRILEADDDHLEVPIHREPTEATVEAVIEQETPRPRVRGLDDRLRERGWTADELARAPGSWAVVGSVILVRFDDCPREREVGEALLDLHGEADTVLAREGIDGPHREPTVRVVAGAGDTETVHTEHGTRYALDLARVMFSPGNEAERVRMGTVVRPDERVLDMFAGVGYFTLPMARAGARVTAVERNPVAFRYLLENAVLNGVEGRVDAYRADCRDVVGVAEVDRGEPETTDGGPATASRGATGERNGTIAVRADRVVMGYYDAPDYLDPALDALAPGGVVHLHATTPKAEPWTRPIERLEQGAAERGRAIELLERRRVKSHSAGVVHVVVDARVT